ncbi:hypothetical protein F4859DRAFT_487286 [Xylaria cf. heliscus]|nr:hypothetical protein F4859DRAFT_487286 [Xylaria cf. heliscus]
MALSAEAIIAIVTLFVAVPSVVVILAKVFRRGRSKRTAHDEESIAEIELDPAPPAFPTISPQLSLLNVPRSTLSLRLVVDGPRHHLEITQQQHFERLSSQNPTFLY